MPADPVIVGFDGTPASRDALRLGVQLAGALGAPVVAAFVFRLDALDLGDSADYHAALRAVAERELQRARDLAPEAELVPVGARSVPRGLHELAVERGAACIVVGGTHRGAIGQIVPGSTAQRLLEGSPCPVAVAPRGHVDVDGLDLVVCGFDGGGDSVAAVDVAGRLAAACRTPLRLVSAVDVPAAFPPIPSTMLAAEIASEADSRLIEEVTERRRKALGDIAAAVPEGVAVEEVLVHGDPADLLIRNSPERTGLLVVGSRGYGPIGAVLMGSVAADVVRHARCAVAVVPRAG